MDNKWTKYILLTVVTGVLAYNSVYLKKLDAKKEITEANLNPAEFAQKFWIEKFTPFCIRAVEVNSFKKMLKEDTEKVFKELASMARIGSSSCFLIKGEGNIISVSENNVIVAAKSGAEVSEVRLTTGLYFGNAVRDVSGLIKMGDLANTIEYNSISSELNKIVQSEIISPLKAKAKKGETIHFIGCAEINREQIDVNSIQLLPVQIRFK